MTSVSISLDHEHGVVVVTYSGTIDLRDRRRAVEQTVKELEEHAYRRVLVDFTGARMSMQSPEEESDFADVLSSYPVLGQSRTAYFSSPGQSINWFIEVLARARHYPCEHFTDRRQAYAWLQEAPEGGR